MTTTNNTPNIDITQLTPEQLRQYNATGTLPQPAAPPAAPPAPAPQAQPPAPAPQAAPPAAPPSPTAPAAPPNNTGLPAPVRQADGSFTITLPTGQVYKGTSEGEAYSRVVEAQINASQRISELNSETQRLRQGIAAVTGNAPQGDPNQPNVMVWDVATYRELQAADPMLAQNYLDACRFGLTDINMVPQVYRDTYATTNEVRAARTINEFRQMAPDFPGTKESVDLVMGYMQRNNLPFTAENLSMVHTAMVKGGKYQPLVVNTPQNTPPPNPAPVPPPTQPQIADINPQGQYAFGPNGFGPAILPSAPAPVTAAPTAPAPAAAYPAMPQVPGQPQPLPAAPSSTGGVPAMPAGELTEDAAAAMDTLSLRRAIEARMQR